VSLVFGSMILIDSPAPELRVSLRLVVAVVLGFSAIGITLVRIGLAAQRQPAVTGGIGMIGQSGRALTAIDPGDLGRVFIHGENWQARADEPIAEGTGVRVAGVNGLILTVRKE
jgi:membrane-bound serine protease (ClpP class)